ncbi:GHKL domain-containing protein [bacterium]|nr:GHKL domain-containing protein [bacterium]
MSESASFLYFVIFFAIAMSSTGWHIMIKGRGLPQNLWLFFIMISNVFIFSSVAAVYFPFSKVYFFVAMLCFVIFSTLFIYSFPHAVLPNIIWMTTIAVSVVFMVVLFIYMKTRLYLVYFVLPLAALALDIPIIFRKIKYLNANVKKFVLFNISAMALLSLLVPVASAFSVMFYNSLYFNVAAMILSALFVVCFGLFLYVNPRSSTGLNRINFWLIILLALPASFLVNFLFSLRFLVTRAFGSANFSLVVLCALFMLFMLTGVAISYFSSSVESFIYKSRNYYQTYLNKFRLEIEDITEAPLLFDKFYECVNEWFHEIKHIKYVYLDDLLWQSSKMPVELYDGNDDFQPLLSEQFLLHETYVSKDFALISVPTLEDFVKKTGGDFFLPVIYHNELTGFFVINSRNISHNAMLCISNLAEMTLNKFEKISLFATVIETEKKVEMLKHFKEVDKMLSFVAHELRSPMTSIMFNIEVVKDAIDRKKDIDTEYLDISLKELKRLNDTIEKMLVYGRNIKLSPYPYNFRSFFAEMKQFFSYADRTVNFTDQTGGREFMFDWDVLKNVFVNLVNNSLQALEKTDRVGRVKVTVAKKKKKLLIEVADNGPGIPPEHKDSIFEPFYTTKKNGNGLGLATCEKIVKLSGGSIVLWDTSSSGTVFHITFPIESVSVK